jgi:signal transduction histidine kinase/DNA-binding NarL/FixJ family response regulator
MAAKIAVVDDSPTQRAAIALALERKGFLVVQASNGLEAIQVVHRENPDLLVSDIMMPELTGYQVCRLLKNDPTQEDLPIVLLTTLAQQQHRFWGKEAGADSYVLKSMDSSPLEKEVARLLDERRRLPEEQRKQKGPATLGRLGPQARLTDLLERLLFEATVANRIRETARFSGNLIRSLEAFFVIFQKLIDYQIAVVCMRRSDGPLMVIHLGGKVSAGLLESVREKIRQDGLLPASTDAASQEVILNLQEGLSAEDPAEETKMAVLSIPFSNSLQEGGVAAFHSNTPLYTEECWQAIKIAARELEPILKLNLQSEAMERLKADFTAMIVHDLRTPLMSVMSGAALVEDGLVGPVNDEQKKWLAKIGEGSRKLLDLVNDFLDLSKLEAGRIDLAKEETDLPELIKNAIDSHLVLARDKSISLRSACGSALARIQADPRRLEQVLTNLLSNAVKFTDKGGVIEVGISQENMREVKVWVKDSGIGIPAEEIANLFEKYRQTTSGRSSKQKGTGLGLVICKMIVEAHEGRIWIESREGKGTTFFFSLPMQPNLISAE